MVSEPGADGVLARVRAAGGTVVATGGCFDLLHAGHVATLRAARGLGDCLVVCINSDDSVRRLKGPVPPAGDRADRARVLEALEFVDAVVVFEEDTPAEVLDRLRPDVWAKGGDYAGADLPGGRGAAALGRAGRRPALPRRALDDARWSSAPACDGRPATGRRGRCGRWGWGTC